VRSTAGAARAENAFVRLCHSGLGVSELQPRVLSSLRTLMPVDAAFFPTADPETLLLTGAYVEEPLGASTPLFLANEFGSPDVNKFASLATATTHVATLDQATHHDRTASSRANEIMAPLGWATKCAPRWSSVRTAGGICACTDRTTRSGSPPTRSLWSRG
jgi:hypothetical protein